MKIRHYLPVLFISLLPALNTDAQDQTSRQQLQEQPDEWDDASWSPPDQDSTGLPGDNFSLQGALTLFKQANTPEEFEKLLNTEENKVNNLDLNGDGNIDYLRVINKKQNQVQLFIIQALVSNQESQDIAVIELEKTAEGTAVVQIAGDEDIYGETTLAEPVEQADSLYSAEDNSFYYNTPSQAHGPAADESISRIAPAGVIVNVWYWPCVRRVYAPAYVVWTSPWSWINPPVWWRPWRPMPVYAYRPVCQHYRYGYAYAPTRRIPPARGMYYPVRTYSGTVYNRNRVVMTNYRSTRSTRGSFPGYNGGRYNGNNRNSYYGGRNNYNSYRNGYRDNYGRNYGRPGYYNDRGGRPQGGGRPSGNYQPGPRGNYQGDGRPSGNYQPGPRGNYQGDGRPSGNYQPGPGGGSYQGGGRPSGNYQPSPGSGNSQGGGRPSGDYQPGPGSGNSQGGGSPSGDNQPGPRGGSSQNGVRPRSNYQPGPRNNSSSGGRTSTTGTGRNGRTRSI